MNSTETPDKPNAPSQAPTIAALAASSPAVREMLQPLTHSDSWINDAKVRRLFLQASAQQWFVPTRIDFDQPIQFEDEKKREILIRFNVIFYTLEKMGLNVIQNMMAKAVRRLKSEEAATYLAVQASDEARHVFTIEQYLRKLGSPPRYERKLHVLGQAASMGLYRVENWLFSTLFSENFASAFLRRYKAANPDPVGSEMCKNLLVDESRHLHFLHIVLPDILDRLSLFGRAYVKGSQFFIMKFTEMVARTLDAEGRHVGIDRRALLEEAFENVERAYEGFGVTKQFLRFPRIKSTA